MCADLLDYLARDSYFCNLDLPVGYRFLNFLFLDRDSKGKRRVVVRLWKGIKGGARRDILTDLSRLLQSRYILAERAYFHHAKIISGAMIGRAIQEANLANELDEEKLYVHSDDSLIRALSESKNALAAKLGSKILSRQLHKRHKSYLANDFEGAQDHGHDDVDYRDRVCSRLANAEERRNTENRFADIISAHPGDVLFYAPADRDMNNKVAEMKITWRASSRALKEISDPAVTPMLDAILKAHRSLWAVHILVSPEIAADDEKLQTLTKLFQLEFLTHQTEKPKAETALYSELAERKFYELELPLSAKNLKILRARVSESLKHAARDEQTFDQRLTSLVKGVANELQTTD